MFDCKSALVVFTIVGTNGVKTLFLYVTMNAIYLERKALVEFYTAFGLRFKN